MDEQSGHFYEFGRFRINVEERVLLRDADVVPLTPKVFEILLTLVENGGHVISKDDLMKRVWPDSFVEEGNLTQSISLLRKALGEGQNGHQYIETIARRGYRFIAPVSEARGENGAAGAKGSLGLASVELAQTPSAENVKPESSQTTKMRRAAGRFGLNRASALTALAGIVIAAVGILYFSRGSEAVNSPDSVIESIAVLPFANDAADTDTEYFNDKITESLINNLSQLPKLRVVPRGLVFGYKGREVDLRKIGREMNVRTVLTGRVHRRGDTLSIQVDLIDVANVSQLWGQHYDRKISDILLVQEDISNDIFANLRMKLSVEEKKQLDAFSLYLKGRNYLNKRTADGLQQGIEYFQQAIDVDPDYAPAYAGLADCYNMLVVYGISKPQDAFPRAKEAALKALKIDDTLAEAHT
jgi:DNA-binding winged helix-turn-helix (wHTH) protein/TolB-like protein